MGIGVNGAERGSGCRDGKGATTRKRDRRRTLQVGLAGLLTLAVVLFAFGGNSPPLQRLSALVFDLYQNIKPRAEAGAPIVVVDIDEASIRELGQWPWPRSEIARIVDRLRELGAAAIAFDVVFSDPDRTSLSTAAEALMRAGATVTSRRTSSTTTRSSPTPSARAASIAGFVLTNETDAAAAAEGRLRLRRRRPAILPDDISAARSPTCRS